MRPARERYRERLDAELVAMVKAGVFGAYDALDERYRSRVRQAVRTESLGGVQASRDEVEALTQEVMAMLFVEVRMNKRDVSRNGRVEACLARLVQEVCGRWLGARGLGATHDART